ARLEGASADYSRARPGHDSRRALDLVRAFNAARSRHHHHSLRADLDGRVTGAAGFHHRSTGAKGPAGELVGRHDAVRFFDALHHFERGDIELFFSAHAAENSMHHARRAVDIESEFDQAIDHILYLRLGGAFLHYDEHRLTFALLSIARRLHTLALQRAHFIDNPFKDTPCRLLRHGAVVVLGHVIEHLFLALRLVDRHLVFALETAYLFHDASPFVEQLQNAPVEHVDAVAPFGEYFGGGFGRH